MIRITLEDQERFYFLTKPLLEKIIAISRQSGSEHLQSHAVISLTAPVISVLNCLDAIATNRSPYIAVAGIAAYDRMKLGIVP